MFFKVLHISHGVVKSGIGNIWLYPLISSLTSQSETTEIFKHFNRHRSAMFFGRVPRTSNRMDSFQYLIKIFVYASQVVAHSTPMLFVNNCEQCVFLALWLNENLYLFSTGTMDWSRCCAVDVLLSLLLNVYFKIHGNFKFASTPKRIHNSI